MPIFAAVTESLDRENSDGCLHGTSKHVNNDCTIRETSIKKARRLGGRQLYTFECGAVFKRPVRLLSEGVVVAF